jgi:hypothetical protein
MNSFIWHFLNIVAVLYIFVFSWKLKRYLKLQNSNWIQFSNWPWRPVYWPWCPEKLSNIQGQTGLASIFPKFEAWIFISKYSTVQASFDYAKSCSKNNSFPHAVDSLVTKKKLNCNIKVHKIKHIAILQMTLHV